MRDSRGFTLLELVVGLTIGSVLVLTAARLFGDVTEDARRLTERRERLDRDANGLRLLGKLVESIDVASPGAIPFHGERDRILFSAWSSRSRGWPILRSYTVVAIDPGLAVVSQFDTLVVAVGVDSLALDYLPHAGANESWVRGYLSPTSLPLGIRFRLWRLGKPDTLLLLVGSE
jgi:prepilin-type N-terminal cleavage/methylation domain-containing protein